MSSHRLMRSRRFITTSDVGRFGLSVLQIYVPESAIERRIAPLGEKGDPWPPSGHDPGQTFISERRSEHETFLSKVFDFCAWRRDGYGDAAGPRARRRRAQSGEGGRKGQTTCPRGNHSQITDYRRSTSPYRTRPHDR